MLTKTHFKNMNHGMDNKKLKLLGLRESTRADTPGNKSFLSKGDSSYLLLPYKSVEKNSPESCIYSIT